MTTPGSPLVERTLWALSALALASQSAPRPLLINESPSLPLGLYLRLPRERPKVGTIVAAHPPSSARRYLSTLKAGPHARLLKRVVAASGEPVCRIGRRVSAGGRVVIAATSDRRGVALPAWEGCKRLGPGDVFLLGDTPSSFDSRYFGPVPISRLDGAYREIWTWPGRP